MFNHLKKQILYYEGLLFKEWHNRESNGDKLIKESFEISQNLPDVVFNYCFYKNNWFNWSFDE